MVILSLLVANVRVCVLHIHRQSRFEKVNIHTQDHSVYLPLFNCPLIIRQLGFEFFYNI